MKNLLKLMNVEYMFFLNSLRLLLLIVAWVRILIIAVTVHSVQFQLLG